MVILVRHSEEDIIPTRQHRDGENSTIRDTANSTDVSALDSVWGVLEGTIPAAIVHNVP